LEEQRIGMMYLNLFKRWLGGLWDGVFPRGLRRSAALPAIIVLLVVGVPLAAWKLHRLGRFGALKREVNGDSQANMVAGPRPGGSDPIVLKRQPTPGSTTPEFLSATLLPGLGMDFLQITASLPNRGEVELLEAPTIKDLADGTTPARTGVNDRWGIIEVPWGGLLSGVLSPLGTTIRTSWRGHDIEAPTDLPARAVAEGGMLNTLSADATKATPESAPTTATAIFKGTDFDQHWISRDDVTVSASLSASAIDLTVTVKNVGDDPQPLGIGWHPRFVIPSGARDAAEVHLPGGEELEIGDRAKGVPTGKILVPQADVARFQLKPWPLGAASVDASLVRLKQDGETAVEVRDPASAFGLRMTAVSKEISELRVTSPSGSPYVGVGMQTNYDDPLGKEWTGSQTPPITILLPGETTQFRIRLEIFPVANRTGAR
jgi:aldose 1-epimerase